MAVKRSKAVKAQASSRKYSDILYEVKDQVEAVLSDTEDYVREKPAQSLVWAFVAGYVLNRLPLGRVLSGLVRLLIVALRPAILIYGAAKLYQAAQEEQ